MKTHFLLLMIAALFGVVSSRLGAEEKSWKGESVLYTRAPTDIKISDVVGGKLVEIPVSGQMPLTVLEERNGKLRIDDDGTVGWVDKADFVPERDAIGFFSKRIAANANDSWALYARGSVRLWKLDLNKAIQDFDGYIRLNPASPLGYQNRAQALVGRKEYDKAIKDLNEVIRLDPQNLLALVNRGLAWNAKNEFDKAIKDFTDCMHIRPDTPIFLVLRGEVLSEKQDYDKAISDFNEALRLDPRDASALGGRGHAWIGKKDYVKALEDVEQAVSISPKSADALSRRSHVSFMTKRYDKAVEDLSEAIRLSPKNALIRRSRGFILFNGKDYSKAVKDFDEVHRLDPEEGYCAVYGHFAARKMADALAAKRFLNETAAMLKKDAWPFAAVRYLRGEIDEAAFLTAAGEIAGQKTEAHCYLGLDHALKGHTAEALTHFRWVKDHGVTTFFEYGIADAEIERLQRTPKK